MKKWLLLGLFVSSQPVIAQNQAPFCVVTGAGNQCFYYDATACRNAAQASGGMCVVNQQTVAQPRPQQFNFTQSYQQGWQMGQQQRQAREATEEHAARMRLLAAQTEATQTQQAAPASEYYRAVYRCGDGAEAKYTPHPAPGCVVISVLP